MSYESALNTAHPANPSASRNRITGIMASQTVAPFMSLCSWACFMSGILTNFHIPIHLKGRHD